MRYRISQFWSWNSNFLTLQTLEFKKKLTRIFGIKNKNKKQLESATEVPSVGTSKLTVLN